MVCITYDNGYLGKLLWGFSLLVSFDVALAVKHVNKDGSTAQFR